MPPQSLKNVAIPKPKKISKDGPSAVEISPAIGTQKARKPFDIDKVVMIQR